MSESIGASPDRTRIRTTRRSRALVCGALGLVLVCTAACSSSGGSSSPTSTATVSGTTAGGGVVSVAERGSLGAILVDRSGATLYHYTPDGTGKTTCTEGCATAWPPLTVPPGTTSPAAGTGITAGELGTITRPDGTLQVTFKGIPLYRYAGDTKAGDANGQGSAGVWYVIAGPTGSGGSTTTTVKSGGGGY